MGFLFNKVEFLKQDCDLENYVDELSTEDSNFELLKESLNCEKALKSALENADINMYVSRDIKIGVDNLQAQIDYMVVTPVHAYLIECKSLIGDVVVDGNNFTRKFGNIEETIDSPVDIAIRNAEIVKRYRDAHRSKVFNSLNSYGVDDYYKPLVVAANINNKLDINNASNEIKDIIIPLDNLIDYFNKEIKETSFFNRDSKDTMLNVANFILYANNAYRIQNDSH